MSTVSGKREGVAGLEPGVDPTDARASNVDLGELIHGQVEGPKPRQSPAVELRTVPHLVPVAVVLRAIPRLLVQEVDSSHETPAQVVDLGVDARGRQT